MMTHYEQAMKHWGNHRKDRYKQQCSGPTDPHGKDVVLEGEKFDMNSMESMYTILETEHSFPIYLAQDGKIGTWSVVPENHLFATSCKDRGSLRAFALDYCFGVVEPTNLYQWCVNKCIEKNEEKDYSQSDLDDSTWVFAGIHFREGLDAVLRFVENYKGKPKKTSVTRAYA